MKFLSKAVKSDDTVKAVAELRQQFSGFPVKTLIFFASYVYDGSRVAELIKNAFPEALTFGCSSYAEIGGGAIRTGSISALAFSDEGLETAVAAVAENISQDRQAVEKAFAVLENKLGTRMIDLDYRAHFGITLFDGSSQNIEKVMDRVGYLTDAIFVGGYASDDFSMRHIQQYIDGRTCVDSAVLAVLKPRGRFALLKTQSAEPLGLSLVATTVDEEERTILELDGKSAAEVYAQSIGIPLNELADTHFLDYPLGVMANGDPFIRAGRRILDNGGLQLFCSVKEGQRLNLMKTGDIVAKTAKALADKRRELGGIGALIDFDCAHRYLTLAANKAIDQYGKLFEGIQAAGFTTFGEAYIANVNQTSVMALFE